MIKDTISVRIKNYIDKNYCFMI